MKNYNELIAENLAWAEETFKKIDKKMSKLTLRSRYKIPDGVDENGVHIDLQEKDPNGWTNGFWGGLNCLLYEHTGNEDYLETAKTSEKIMDKALANFPLLNHDVGFIWHLLSGALHTLTGDPQSRMRNLFAASSFSSRFVLGGEYFRAWNHSGRKTMNWTIIDTMMNLPILFWASRELDDDRFSRLAIAHADTTLREHIRPDGSVVHVVEHNRDTGETVKTFFGQGIAVGSSWSRGQAWALYGFAIAYINTHEKRYLDAAKSVAHYFIANCCDDWLPRIDFRAPSEPVYYDSTAGACAACGLIEIAKNVPEHEAGMYLNAAINILRAMEEKFIDWSDDTDCMLNYASRRYPAGSITEEKAGVHISIIYGDYFYIEAILKLLGSDFNPWFVKPAEHEENAQKK